MILNGFLTNAKHILSSRIQYKIFIISCIAIVIPIMLFGLISYNLSAANVKDDFIKTNLNTNTAISKNIDEHYYSLQRQVFSLFTLHDDIGILLDTEAKLYTDEYFDAINRLNNYYNFHLSSNNIFGISLIDMNGDVKYTNNLDGKTTNLNSVAEQAWFIETLDSNGRTVFREPHINEFLFYATGENPTTVVSISQMIYDVNYGEPLGVVLIDQDMDNFFGYTSNAYYSDNHSLAVYNNTEKMVYANKYLSEAMVDAYNSVHRNSQDELVQTVEADGEDVLFISNPASQFGFRIISSMPISDLRNQSAFLKNNTIITLGILLLIILIVSTIISRYLTGQVHNINHTFDEISHGNLDVRVPVRGNDEIAEIASGFNSTLQNIQKLISEKYTANLLRKKAELDSLYSQINPHFLYNTLGFIKVVSDSNDSQTASSMIQSLSDLLRYSLSKGTYIVSLSDELQHIKNYLKIMQQRFPDLYEIMYEIDDSALIQPIPWMTLQPIVENAVKHGLSDKRYEAVIRITAKTTAESMTLYIYDNGSGIECAKLSELNQSLIENNNEDDSESIGIINVNRRIRMHFGDQFGISLTSKQGSYTVTKIILPLRNGDHDEHTVG